MAILSSSMAEATASMKTMALHFCCPTGWGAITNLFSVNDMKLLLRILFVPLLLCSSICLSQSAPKYVYLTWQGDTSTTITVNYQTMEGAETSSVYYDTEPRGDKTNDYRFHTTGTRHKLEGLADGRTIHWVELKQLKPGQV